MSTEFEQRWEREFAIIRLKVAPWHRKSLPKPPAVLNEETVTQYLTAVKPFVDQGQAWVSISQIIAPPFSVFRMLMKYLSLFYLWFWTPMLCLFLAKELFWVRTISPELSASAIAVEVLKLILLGLPVVVVYRIVSGIELYTEGPSDQQTSLGNEEDTWRKR